MKFSECGILKMCSKATIKKTLFVEIKMLEKDFNGVNIVFKYFSLYSNSNEMTPLHKFKVGVKIRRYSKKYVIFSNKIITV